MGRSWWFLCPERGRAAPRRGVDGSGRARSLGPFAKGADSEAAQITPSQRSKIIGRAIRGVTLGAVGRDFQGIKGSYKGASSRRARQRVKRDPRGRIPEQKVKGEGALPLSASNERRRAGEKAELKGPNYPGDWSPAVEPLGAGHGIGGRLGDPWSPS